MTEIGILQIALYLIIVLALVKPLGWYMALVYEGKSNGLFRTLAPVENFIYRLCSIHKEQEMDWKGYLIAMLLLNFVGMLIVYGIQRLQGFLPLNPHHFTSLDPELALNTAASFITNTDWQAYAGENTLSYFTQTIALTVQNFISAATGMALLVALIRSFKRHEVTSLGNFWVDVTRGIVYILLPLSFIFAIFLTSQGVMQNFNYYKHAQLLQAIDYTPATLSVENAAVENVQIGNSGKIESIENIENIKKVDETYKKYTIEETKKNELKGPNKVTKQIIPMGPVASQVAIKQLGTNGGGFFNTNSAHPFENPTPLTNFLEMLAILLIPAAFCYTFGIMVNDKRQGLAILAAMVIIFVPLMLLGVCAEQNGNEALPVVDIEQQYKRDLFPGGNLEGKETRFGVVSSAIWAAATTASSNGSVNSMHDSFTPIGGFVPLWLMHLGGAIFGGVGSGLYSMLALVIITVFIAGLMIGRTPEYLGKKIEPYEMKMASIAVLIMPLVVLLCAAIACVTEAGIASIANPGIHGFTEIMYAFSSMGSNNGSAFAGLNAGTNFYTILGSIVMLIGRYWIAIPVLAIAGSMVRKKIIPKSSGTLPTHTPLFVIMLISVIIVLGSLAFLPAIALGPIVEQLALWGQYGN